MSQAAQQASPDLTKEPTVPNAADMAAQQPVSSTATSSQRVFRVYKPLAGRAAGGKKPRTGVGARAKKGGFFADRFERYVPSPVSLITG